MKKLLIVLLALVLVFGMATTAFAYSDTSKLATTSQDSIAKLSALDIIGGYPDGTFGPDKNITRAEFAKIAVNLAGLGNAAANLGGTSARFSDVEANAWYTGWVNLANAQGFVQGYPDGTFKPNANISMQEVVTVLLRLAGYDDNLVGPWPYDYIAKASALGVTDDVDFVATAKATRESVAVMGSETLDQNVVYWDKDKDRFLDINAPAKTTLLAESFEATINEDRYLGDWFVKNFDKMELQVGVAATRAAYAVAGGAAPGALTPLKDLAKSYHISDGYTINQLDGMVGDVYLDKDGKIIYIDVTSTIAYTDDLDVTGAAAAKVADKDQGIVAGAVLPAIANNYTAKLFYNEDGDLYRANNLAAAATNAIIIDKYDATNKRIDALYGSSISVKSADVIVFKGGAIASVEDLKAGDVFYRQANAKGVDEVISVSPMKEGKLTAGSGTKLTIDDKKILWAGAVYTENNFDTTANILAVANVDDAFNQTVKYVTAKGNPYQLAVLSYNAAPDTSKVYGIVTAVDGDLAGKISAVTLFNQEGKEVEYPIVKGDTVAKRISWGFAAATNVQLGSYIEAKVSAGGSIDTDNIVCHGFPAANNVVTSVDLTALGGANDYITTAAGTAITRVDSRLLLGPAPGRYYNVTDDTIGLNIKLVGASGSAFDKAQKIAAADLKKASTIANVDGAIAKVKDGNIVAIIFINSTATSSSNYGVLTATRYDGKDWYVSVVGDQEYKAAADYGAIVDKGFYKYTVNNGKLTVANAQDIGGDAVGTINANDAIFKRTAADTISTLATSLVGVAPAAALFDKAPGAQWIQPNGTEAVTAIAAGVEVAAKSGSTLSLGTGAVNYLTNSDTKYFLVKDDTGKGYTIEASDIGAIAKGMKVAAITTEKPLDYTLAYVFIIDKSYPVVSGAFTTGAALVPAGATSTYTITAPAGAVITITTPPTLAAVGAGAVPVLTTDFSYVAGANTISVTDTATVCTGTVTFNYTVAVSGFTTYPGTVTFTLQ